MDRVLLDHLSTTLADQRIAAFTWDVEADSYQWAGQDVEIFGIHDHANLPKTNRDVITRINPQDAPRRLSILQDVLSRETGKDTQVYSLTYRIHQEDGMSLFVDEHGTVVIDPSTGKRYVCGHIKRHEAKQSELFGEFGMAHQGRILLQEKIEERFMQRARGVGYLLVAGIDGFMILNGAYGARFADELLAKVGERLHRMIGDTGFVTRIDGDVFALFLPFSPHNEMAAVAKHILNHFYEVPLETSRGPMGLSVSTGGVLLEGRGTDAATVVTQAEMAMRAAKEQGRGSFIAFGDSSRKAQRNRLLLQSGESFLTALREQRVRLAFQPIMDIRTSSVAFHECLVRIVDDGGKVHAAGDFMPAVEQLGLGRMVDQHMLHLAVQELSAFPDLRLSVNVSHTTLVNRDWLRGAVIALRDRPSVATRLMVEITESAVMRDPDETIRVIRTLRDMGCRVALDDFGVGYTAFAQLKDLQIDVVKLDKSFIRNGDDAQNQLFVQTMRNLAHGINVEMVGEGAETMADVQRLQADGIHHIQGYVYGYPSMERIWLPKGHEFRKADGETTSRTSKQVLENPKSFLVQSHY